MRSVILLGDQATELGEVQRAELGPSCALALSRGRFPKGYPYLDPNEDACLAVTDGERYLLAVADGHNGFDAARAAITALETHAGRILGAADPASEAAEIASQAVREAVGGLPEPRSRSRTALTLAVVFPEHIDIVSAGDTIAITPGRKGPQVLTKPAPFLSTEEPTPYTTRANRNPGVPLMLATDGLIDFLGRHPLEVIASMLEADNARAIVEAAIEAAFAGAAGDNIAVAALVT